MRSSLLGQPFWQSESGASFLARAIADSRSTNLLAATAWVRHSGLTTLESSIANLRSRGGVADLLVGLDYGGTTRQGLRLALDVFSRVYVIHDPAGRTFHPKLYRIQGGQRGYLMVGSNNLTAAGLSYNYEAALTCKLDFRRAEDRRLSDEVDLLATRLISDRAICKKLTRPLFERLASEGWLADEGCRGAHSQEDTIRRRPKPHRADRSAIFARSQALMRTRPPPAARLGETGRRSPFRLSSETTEAWWKQLNATDVQRPPAGHSVGVVRMTRPPGLRIDPSTFFRRDFFAHERWQPHHDNRRNPLEVAEVAFEAYLEDRALGVKRLRVDYGEHRAARSRTTTVLHWDDLAHIVRRRDLESWFLLIEKGAGEVHRLTLTRRQPG